MIEYFINALNDAEEKTVCYKRDIDSKDNDELVNMYNSCLKMDVVKSYDHILNLVAMQVAFMERFGKSPIYLKKCIVGLTGPIKLSGENYEELSLAYFQETIRISFQHPEYHHPFASIEEKVEILAKNPYRYYLYVNIWIGRNNRRLIELDKLMENALNEEKFELCIRILEVKEMLSELYKD